MAQDGIHLPSKEFSENYESIFGKKKKKKFKKKVSSQWRSI